MYGLKNAGVNWSKLSAQGPQQELRLKPRRSCPTSHSPQTCQGHAGRGQASPAGPKVGRTRLRGRWPRRRGHRGAFPGRRGGSPMNGALGPRVHLSSEGETTSLGEGMDPCVGWGPLNTLSVQSLGGRTSDEGSTESRCQSRRGSLQGAARASWRQEGPAARGRAASGLPCPPRPHPHGPAGMGGVGVTLDVSLPCHQRGRRGLLKDSVLPAAAKGLRFSALPLPILACHRGIMVQG